MKSIRKLWAGLVALIALSPLGLIIPAKYGAGTAWGEWSREELETILGYLPRGFSHYADIWKAPMPDYAFRGWENAPMHISSGSYIVSAFLGVVVVVALTFLIGKFVTRND